MDSATGVIAETEITAFTAGTDPTANTEDYSTAFAAAEAYRFNTVCVDTEETAVHMLLASFIDRIFNAGQLGLAIVAEKARFLWMTEWSTPRDSTAKRCTMLSMRL